MADRGLLDIRKTVSAFDFILRSYGQPIPWGTRRGDYEHDLLVMRRHGDLEHAAVEILGQDRTVAYRYRVRFGESAAVGFDAARGIELPILPKQSVSESRVLIGPTVRLDEYRLLLRNRWARADRLTFRNGGRFVSEHTARINGGRVAGEVFVADDSRKSGTLLNVAQTGCYGFVRHPQFPSDIYVHQSKCPPGMRLAPGLRISFVVVQTPRGLQAYDIRRA